MRNVSSGGAWYKRNNINKAAQRRKKLQHEQNHQTRAEVNRSRSNSTSNPAFHGMGYHALGRVRQAKRRTGYRRSKKLV